MFGAFLAFLIIVSIILGAFAAVGQLFLLFWPSSEHSRDCCCKKRR